MASTFCRFACRQIVDQVELSSSLAGRIDVVTLWPLSMGELSGGADGFADRAFDAPADLVHQRGATPSRRDYLELVCRGGYPEANRLSDRSRRRWFERYLETVLRREVESVADLRRFDALLGMARLLMATTGSELVVSSSLPCVVVAGALPPCCVSGTELSAELPSERA